MGESNKLGDLLKKGGEYIKENPDKVEKVVKTGIELINDLKKKKDSDDK